MNFKRLRPVYPSESKDPLSCNICLMNVSEPVVTPCGHLFCWPCLFLYHKEIQTSAVDEICICILCKCNFDISEVISLYLNDSDKSNIEPNNSTNAENMSADADISKINIKKLKEKMLKSYVNIPSRPVCFRDCSYRKRPEYTKPKYVKTYGGMIKCRKNDFGKNVKSAISALIIFIAIVLYGLKNKYFGT